MEVRPDRLKEIISAAEAARILGVPPQMVRERIKRGIWKFGRRIPKEKFEGKQDRYEIYTQKMLDQIGGENAKLQNSGNNHQLCSGRMGGESCI